MHLSTSLCSWASRVLELAVLFTAKVFAFALTIPGEYISLAALAWYDLPRAKVPNGLLSPTRVASQRSARYAKAAADAVVRIRKAYFNEDSAHFPLSFYSASKSTNILAKLVNEEAFKGKKFPVCLPKNQTVIKVWTEDATNAKHEQDISDRTASRWAFEKDERYHQYDASLALGWGSDFRMGVGILRCAEMW